jgi:hypothetical protein
MSNEIDGIHTTTNPKGTGWVNQANGVLLSRHHIKSNAVAAGRQLAKRHGEQFTVHRKDGSVIETRTYGTSPV